MNQVTEIDLRELLLACLYKLWLIILCAAIVAGAAYIYTDNFVTPMYRAEVSFYVNNSSFQVNPNHSISSSDLATSQRLVLTYVNIIKSDLVLDKVVAESGMDITSAQLRSCMTAESMDQTELFKVQINHKDPQMAADLANAIAAVAPGELANIMVGSATRVLDMAKVPTTPYTPNVSRNALIGGLAGMLLAIVIIVVQTLMDVRIKCEEDIIRVSSVPILGSVPDFTAPAAEPYSFRKQDAEAGRR